MGHPFDFLGPLLRHSSPGLRHHQKLIWIGVMGGPQGIGYERKTKKMKGRFLLRDLALSIPIFGDPVRLPDHNFCFPRITQDSRTCVRALLAFLRSLSPQELPRRHPFPVAWPESRCRFSKMTVCSLSPLEDRSPVESNTTPQQQVRKGSRIILCCGNVAV